MTPADALVKKAMRSTDGEFFAWMPEDLPAVSDWLRDAGLAVLGCELWVFDGDQPVWRSPTTGVARQGLVWTSRSRGASEPWGEFVTRSITETLGVVLQHDGTQLADPVPTETIYYYVNWVSETEHGHLGRRLDA